ncbi:TfuA-like protein [Sphingomonas pituitosa]|uniref:TfuA-like protein n=1 Tax=Sphingomonas pituitosa TaxID=99597 RepID=UPI000A689562|nr:TfuA-like protein [Sphingomonas pituitosa]
MIVVFLGPTLPATDAARELEARYAPPAVQGDIYRAVRGGATAIGLVDGHFESVPSVWHKEILWALDAGIPVYGSASMGALRAAELWNFGMVGVGSVFERYRDGDLVDDDEVALCHLLAAQGYRHITEPLVDMRATIAGAVDAQVLGVAAGEALVRAAKSLHYSDRTYSQLVAATRPAADDAELAAFERWWPEHRVSVKRNDAVSMLRTMKQALGAGEPVARPFFFERTALWDDLVREALDWDGRAATLEGTARITAADSDASADLVARDLALARILARDQAQRHSFRLDENSLAEAIVSIRTRLALNDADALDAWMQRNDLDRGQLLRFAADEARLLWVRAVMREEIDAMMADQLRSSGTYRQAGGTGAGR